ncbi:MAG: hypothetical protein ACRDT0_01225 [Pseudonocardiaceae bacterium]
MTKFARRFAEGSRTVCRRRRLRPVIAEVLQLKRQQAEPLRDPQLPLVTPTATDPARVRLLARAVLDRAGTEAAHHAS